MNALSRFSPLAALGSRSSSHGLLSSLRSARPQALLWASALLGILLIAFTAGAATNGGTALQAAYTSLNDIIGGYGKQLLTVIGFAVAAIGYMASNATSVIMKFIGFAVFLGVGLAAAVGLVGAVI